MSVELNKMNFRSIPEKLFNTKNLALVDEYFHPDYTENAPLPPGYPAGREACRTYFAELFTAFPDLHATVTEIVGEGDRVAGRIICRGTHLGSFMGIPASGKVVEWTESHFGRMKDGKLIEHWTDWDQFGMFQQMGVIPQPEQASAPQPGAQATAS